MVQLYENGKYQNEEIFEQMDNNNKAYWTEGNRLNLLENAVKDGPKYVVCIPCGRKRFLELLMPHVIESKLASEIHLWFNPRNQEDADYINNILPSYDNRCKIINRPNNEPLCWSIAEFHPIENDENTVYLKVDDDDIWFEKGAIDRIFEFRIQHPKYLIVSPLVINNGYCSYMLKDVMPFTD